MIKTKNNKIKYKQIRKCRNTRPLARPPDPSVRRLRQLALKTALIRNARACTRLEHGSLSNCWRAYVFRRFHSAHESGRQQSPHRTQRRWDTEV